MKTRYIAAILLLLILAGLQPALASTDTEYFAVFMEGVKVGYSIQTRRVSNEKVTTTEQVNMTISRFNVPISMNMVETSIETTGDIFKINDHHTAYYSRLWMRLNPEHKGFFRTRLVSGSIADAA